MSYNFSTNFLTSDQFGGMDFQWMEKKDENFICVLKVSNWR